MLVHKSVADKATQLILLAKAKRRSRFVREFLKRMDEHEAKVLEAVREILKEQLQDVLQALRGTKSEEPLRVPPNVSAYQQDWDRRLQEILEPLYFDMVDEAAAYAVAQLGVGLDFELFNVLRLEFIGDKLSKVVGINETTISNLDTMFREAIQEGISIPKVADRVREFFSDADERRATVIARTEVISSSNGGAQSAYQASGVVDQKEWLTAVDGRERPAHRLMNGVRVALNKPFKVPRLDSRSPGVDLMMYPGDPNGSAGNVIQCRCAIAPVVLEDESRTAHFNPEPSGPQVLAARKSIAAQRLP